MDVQSNKDLLSYLLKQMESGQKNWFGFSEQRITGINLSHQIAANHADKMTPVEIVEYVAELNNEIYKKFIKYG